jgi:hypothetical protein
MVKTTVKLLIDPQNNSLTFSKNFRIFSTVDPICKITEFTDFVEDLVIDSPNTLDLTKLTRSFRYSRNRLDWSLWYQVSPGNLGDAANIFLDDCDGFYFEVKYEYDDGTSDELSTPIIINEVKLRFKQVESVANTYSPKLVCSDEKCTSIVQNANPSFRPYNVDSAIGMYQELSFFTNQLYGHQVVYFRTLPDSNSGDYVFKEWTLYKNIDRKCIKVMVKDNAFPENTPKYTEFGIDFQLPFEIEVDHKYFQSIFGSNSEPRKRDFLYFPLLNRMFEIQGSYLNKGFMMAPTFWKIQLKKYNPNIDMLLTDDSRSFLDNVILSADQLFSEEVEKDIKDSTMPAQYNKITTTFDSSRKAIHPDITQRPLKYTFNYAPLIENYYDLGNISQVNSEPAIIYNSLPRFNMTDSKNLSFTCLFNVPSISTAINFIDGYSDSTQSGIQISAVFARYSSSLPNGDLTITVKINSQIKNYVINNFVSSTWHALVISASNEFKQSGAYVYSIKEDPSDIINHNGFIRVLSNISSFTQESFDLTENYQLLNSKLLITNIRIFNTMLREEEHDFILSQQFLKDESMIVLIDNCRPQSNLPYIAKNR